MARALYQKMGIKEEFAISAINPPLEFDTFFKDVPFSIRWTPVKEGVNLIHFFPRNTIDLESQLPILQDVIHKDGMIWVSWFKKASKIPSDLNEDIIRNTALALKLVDVKVCSVSEKYSALKLVIRKHLR